MESRAEEWCHALQLCSGTGAEGSGQTPGDAQTLDTTQARRGWPPPVWGTVACGQTSRQREGPEDALLIPNLGHRGNLTNASQLQLHHAQGHPPHTHATPKRKGMQDVSTSLPKTHTHACTHSTHMHTNAHTPHMCTHTGTHAHAYMSLITNTPDPQLKRFRRKGTAGYPPRSPCALRKG